MNRIGLLATLGAGVALGCQGCSDAEVVRSGELADEAGRSQPNIVAILLDDAGYGDFGTPQPSAVPTPALDALARAGTIFSESYASAPVCSPTRAALLTGIHPARLGLRRGLAGRSQRGIPASVETLPELLQREGYATALVGKWHLGFQDPSARPEAQGFGTVVMRAKDPTARAGGGYFDPVIETDGAPGVPHRGHQTQVFTDHAIRFVREHRDEPFFLALWYKAPHAPIEPPEPWAKRFPDDEAGRYAALMGFTDEQIGRLLDTLDELGLADRTLVIVTSDNGALSAEMRTQLRGGKAQLFEGGIRVPLVVRWPGRVPAGRVNESLVASVDLLPTLAEILDIDVSGLGLDGESFLRALETGEPRPRSGPLFWEVREFSDARSLPEDSLNTWAVRRGHDKLVYAEGRLQLFDLSRDPAESRDLAGDRPGLRAELSRLYTHWRMTAPRIEPRVESVEGAVELTDGWDFSRGGAVTLAPDALYDFNDGDFSFAARIRLEAGERERAGVIARQRGSWELRLTPARRLELSVERERGAPLVLRGRTSLPAGVEVGVAFTALGLRTSGSVIRLYADAKLEAGSMDLRAVRASGSPIEIAGEPPFRGSLRALRLFAASLTPAELGAL